MKIEGKNVLITGGSAGLGAEIARQFASEKCNIVINYAHSSEQAEALVKELENTDNNIKAFAIQGDVSKQDSINKLVEQTVEMLGGLDIVISNAGWTKVVPFNDLDSLTEEVWDGCFDMNVKAHFFLFKAVKPYLEENKGAFVVSGSIAGVKPAGSSLAYSVTKTGLTHLVKCLAKTFGNVRSNVVCPGLLLTEWGRNFGEERIEQIRQHAPLKEVTSIEECAEMFLSIAKNKSMTGAVVSVDAGMSVV